MDKVDDGAAKLKEAAPRREVLADDEAWPEVDGDDRGRK